MRRLQRIRHFPSVFSERRRLVRAAVMSLARWGWWRHTPPKYLCDKLRVAIARAFFDNAGWASKDLGKLLRGHDLNLALATGTDAVWAWMGAAAAGRTRSTQESQDNDGEVVARAWGRRLAQWLREHGAIEEEPGEWKLCANDDDHITINTITWGEVRKKEGHQLRKVATSTLGGVLGQRAT